MDVQTVTLEVKRSGDGKGASWQTFTVPRTSDKMNVLDALIWVQRNVDASLAFRCACRVGMCGTCGTVINGREALACRTPVDRDLRSGRIRVEPMRNMPLVRDLVTDMSAFHDKLRRAAPQVASGDPEAIPAAIPPESKERRAIDPQRECIYCGLCYSACTIVGLDDEFLGPAALNRAFLALADSRNSRDTRTSEGLEAVAHEEGLWRCHTLFDCTAVCPQDISPTMAIQRLKRQVVLRKVKRLLRLRV